MLSEFQMFEYFPIVFVLWFLDWFHYCQAPYFVWFCLFLSVMTQDMARWMLQVQLKWIPTLLCSDARLRNTSAGWYSALHLCNLSYYFYLLMREECWIPTPAFQLCCGFIYSRTRESLLKLSVCILSPSGFKRSCIHTKGYWSRNGKLSSSLVVLQIFSCFSLQWPCYHLLSKVLK